MLMRIPSMEEALSFIKEAEQMNPGLWVQHSFNTAEAAKIIAEHHPCLEPHTAYILGLLHDIGRREGIWQMRHGMDGYRYLSSMGFEDAARICITHSFAYKDAGAVCGKWDCSEEDFQFVQDYLSKIEYNDYDRLIQLCDVLAEASGFCLLEKRMVDVALRYGTTKYTVLKWKTVFNIKSSFDRETGCNIYELLPGIIENTFGFKNM